jgi:hypothetical protein
VTKKKNIKPKKALSDQEFNALVDGGFDDGKPARKRQDFTERIWKPTDDQVYELERDGADPRISKGAARMNALLCRCLGVPVAPLSEDAVKFLNDFDSTMRDIAHLHGIELRDNK